MPGLSGVPAELLARLRGEEHPSQQEISLTREEVRDMRSAAMACRTAARQLWTGETEVQKAVRKVVPRPAVFRDYGQAATVLEAILEALEPERTVADVEPKGTG